MCSRATLAALVYLGTKHVSAEESIARCGAAGQPTCPSEFQEGDEVGLLSLRASVRTRSEGAFGPFPPPGPAFPQPTANSSECPIQTADQYKKKWAELAKTGHHEEPGCVSAELYASMFQCGGEYLYGPDAQKAWLGGKVDLEQFMYLQWKFGQKNASAVTAGIAVIIGFGPPSLDGDFANNCLAVFSLPKNNTALYPVVPTGSYWFSFMAQKGYFFNYQLQQEMVLAYASGESPLDVMHRLTHCSIKALKQLGNELIADSKCSTNSSNVYKVLSEVGDTGTLGCVEKFWANEGNLWSLDDMGAVRMMLNNCFDVNPFNTFIGLGWNSYPNPLVCNPPGLAQTTRDHYTGEEYVIDNLPIADFGEGDTTAEVITLADVDAKTNKYLTTAGFCW